MGLFGSKKIYVSSTVQNMAGDELKRPNYLKTTVIGNVLADNKTSMGEVIQKAYLNGPGVRLRSFFNWAQDNYSIIGLPTARVGLDVGVDAQVVGPEIPLAPIESAFVQDIQISVADFSFWAEQWMMKYHPALLNTEWEADYNEVTGQITVLFADSTTEAFTPLDYEKDRLYLYATYVKSSDGSEGAIEIGDTNVIDYNDPFPNFSAWTQVSSTTQNINKTLATLTTVNIEYSDGRPSEYSQSTTERDESYEYYHAVYTREVYEGSHPTGSSANGTETTKVIRTLTMDKDGYVVGKTPVVDYKQEEISAEDPENPDAKITKSTTTIIYDEEIVRTKQYRFDQQKVVIKSWEGPYIYIYKIGSGNEDLDEIVSQDSGDTQFFPFIPIRISNKFISETYFQPHYRLAKKALRKAVGGKFDDIVESLSELESLPDIDYVYAFFGVSANAIENSARKYMYLFFERLMDNVSGTTPADYAIWLSQVEDFNEANEQWILWQSAQESPSDPLYNTPEPVIPPYPSIPASSVRVTSQGLGGFTVGLDIELSWQSMTRVTGTGKGKPGANKGDVWFDTTLAGSKTILGDIWIVGDKMEKEARKIDKIRMYYQSENNSWEAIDIVGMIHRNYIYKGKYVEIGLREGLDDTEDSGFLIPLHYPTYKSMSLVDTTQMSTACTFLVFNSYVVKKTGLLGSLFFKIFIIVVIIAVVVFAPQLAPGLVKAAAATGSTLGLSGTAALIAGAAVNAIAAMVVTSVVMKAAVEVFGEKLGLIIGTVISIIGANGLQNLANGQGFTINFGNMMSAQNLTMLTSSVGNVYAKFVAMSAMDTIEKAQELQQEYEADSQRINELFAQNFGYDNGVIDPMQFVDSSEILVEQPETFLNRTLLTGMDIAQMSLDMLSSFPDITLSNNLPIGR